MRLSRPRRAEYFTEDNALNYCFFIHVEQLLLPVDHPAALLFNGPFNGRHGTLGIFFDSAELCFHICAVCSCRCRPLVFIFAGRCCAVCFGFGVCVLCCSGAGFRFASSFSSFFPSLLNMKEMAAMMAAMIIGLSNRISSNELPPFYRGLFIYDPLHFGLSSSFRKNRACQCRRRCFSY